MTQYDKAKTKTWLVKLTFFYVCCVDPCKVHEISYREQVDTCWCCSTDVSPAWTHPKNGPG